MHYTITEQHMFSVSFLLYQSRVSVSPSMRQVSHLHEERYEDHAARVHSTYELFLFSPSVI